MKSELIVDVQSAEISTAFLEDDRLMEVSREPREANTFSVGNIYYGRVKKVMPALNAVFVDVGYEKEAFLHYLDLGSEFLTTRKFVTSCVSDRSRRPQMAKLDRQPQTGKEGQIADLLKVGDEILVQVVKEPINTKGPRLTAEISLAGRNIVLMPFADKVMVSNKIKSESEKSRLKQLLQSICPKGFGVIVRTQAEGKRVAELDNEMRALLKRWEETIARLQQNKKTPALIREEIGRTIGVIRDVFTPDFESIYVNDEETYNEISAYVDLIAPECTKRVHFYKADQPIFDHFQVTRQMKTGLGRTVSFKNGGYLILERTEALFSIDVNSGSKKLFEDQDENAFGFNMLAADEIAHQLRLRDIGGIIIIDFIDMDSKEHQQELYDHMRQLLEHDRARHNVLPLSKFGLMQITRQRVRPVLEVDMREVCPTCMGKGKVQSSISFTDTIEEQIVHYTEHFGNDLMLHLHPYVFAYVNQGLFSSLRGKWKRHYGVRTIANEALGMLEYRFLDKQGKMLDLPTHDDSKHKDEDDKPFCDLDNKSFVSPKVELVKTEEKKLETPKQETVKANEPKKDDQSAAAKKDANALVETKRSIDEPTIDASQESVPAKKKTQTKAKASKLKQKSSKESADAISNDLPSKDSNIKGEDANVQTPASTKRKPTSRSNGKQPKQKEQESAMSTDKKETKIVQEK